MHYYLDYGPDSPEELLLKTRLAELQAEYSAASQPLLNRLHALQSERVPKLHPIHEIHQIRPI